MAAKYVHIGKTCGGTVRKILGLKTYHTVRVPTSESSPLVVSVRHPVDRLVSAFYWRQLVLSERKVERDRHPEELVFFKCFETVNDLAASVEDQTECGQMARDSLVAHGKTIASPVRGHRVLGPHHMNLNHEYHMGNWLEAHPGEPLYVINAEQCLDDAKNVARELNIKPPKNSGSIHEHKNSKKSTPITDATRKILTERLSSDIAVYDEIRSRAINL